MGKERLLLLRIPSPARENAARTTLKKAPGWRRLAAPPGKPNQPLRLHRKRRKRERRKRETHRDRTHGATATPAGSTAISSPRLTAKPPAPRLENTSPAEDRGSGRGRGIPGREGSPARRAPTRPPLLTARRADHGEPRRPAGPPRDDPPGAAGRARQGAQRSRSGPPRSGTTRLPARRCPGGPAGPRLLLLPPRSSAARSFPPLFLGLQAQRLLAFSSFYFSPLGFCGFGFFFFFSPRPNPGLKVCAPAPAQSQSCRADGTTGPSPAGPKTNTRRGEKPTDVPKKKKQKRSKKI